MFRKVQKCILMFGLFIIYLAVAVACGESGPTTSLLPTLLSTPFPTLRPTPTLASLPDFIAAINPNPRSLFLKGDWDTLVVILRPTEIAAPGENLTPEDIQQRTQLLVDGQALTIRAHAEHPLTPLPYVSGSVSLGTGEHKATIRVRTTSGQVLEHSWSFLVVDKEPPMPGLPAGFQFVRPIPDSTITRQQYEEELLIPEYYVPGFLDYTAGVCVGIFGYEIAAGATTPMTAEEVQDSFYFVALDGVPPGPKDTIEGGYELPNLVYPMVTLPPVTLREPLDLPTLSPEWSPKPVQEDVSAHHYKCWRVDLAPGRHEATVRLEWPSGKVIEFTWWFVITE